LVAKTGRASHTVTRYPRTLATRTSALVKSTAPNTTMCGAGVNASRKTVTDVPLIWPCHP
jgi:hypothetical protein